MSSKSIEHIGHDKFIIQSSCVSDKTYEDLVGKLADLAKWKMDIPFDLPKEKYLDMACDKKNPGLKIILPVIEETNPVLIYHDCLANNYSSIRRDCIGLPIPADAMLEKFKKFTDRIFEQEIRPMLDNFEYSVSAYYNHLDAGQQRRWDTVNHDALTKRVYGNFCKLEKQEVTSSLKNPKNRNIASPNEEYKFVMGPVIYRLEQIFKKNFKGYASGRSWSQRERVLNARAEKMLTKLLQGDGSGFDRTQYAELRDLCEVRIYQWLADAGYIYHVDKPTFLAQSNCHTIIYNIRQMGKSGKYTEVQKLGKVIKKGTVQSGNCDTTFGNTLRMSLYIRFIAEELLHLIPDEYDLDCAGDDFALFVSPYMQNDVLIKAFYQVFRPSIKGESDDIKHGLGQILKYLKIGGIESCDFCSTETFWSERTKSYKIIRKIDRFFTLTPYSRKCLHLSRKDQLEYMQQLSIANTEWIGKLPLLAAYNKLIGNYQHYNTHKYNFDKKSVKGISKKMKPLEKPHYKQLYDEAYSMRFNNLKSIFETDEAYAMMDRISDKTGCEQDFYDYMLRTYTITPAEIAHCEKQILEAIDKPITHKIQLPLFKVICDQKLKREAEITYNHLDANGQPVWLS